METLEALGFSHVSQESAIDGSKTRPFLRCILLVLMIPALLYPTAFMVVSMPSYERWGTSKWGPVLDYAFHPQARDADVLIFGDSSAFLGIDPRLINQQLGTNSIVFPATIGSLPVVGDKALQLYLSQNRRPRLLVFYFAPWNLDYQSSASVGLFEGEEMLFRYGSGSEIVHFAFHHPGELFKFPFRFYSSFTFKALKRSWSGPNRESATAMAHGHVDYIEEQTALKPPCTLPAPYLADTRTNSIADLVGRYSAMGIPIMVYMAPIPNCDNVALITQRPFGQLNAASPKLLPAYFFAGDNYYVHLRPGFVPIASKMFAQALGTQLQRVTSAARP